MKIGIIGRLAENEELYDGQTIKTRVLKQALINRFPESSIMCIETYQIKKHLLFLPYKTARLLHDCDYVFVLLSHNGRNVFFPLLYYLNKIYKKPIYHDAIGGRLANEVREKRNWKKYINSFNKNWVELPSLQNKLIDLGVSNAETLPNFKFLPIINDDDLNLSIPQIFKFCTFSRVVETKGITTAAQAIAFVNKKAGKKIAELYVYGSIDPAYKEKFEVILEKQKNEVFYCGAVPFDKSVEKIKDYYMLLFPSTHSGEGFPGTFIDAFAAGLPIIASDWNYNAEIIKDGVTGFCYPADKTDIFFEYIWKSIINPSNILAMKKNCLREAEKYSAENVMNIIEQQMKKDKR